MPMDAAYPEEVEGSEVDARAEAELKKADATVAASEIVNGEIQGAIPDDMEPAEVK